jgi:uncharacterized protein (TIGR03437 family)
LFEFVSDVPGPLYGQAVTILTCPNGSQQPGVYCTFWGNGFGPTKPPLTDGVPAPASPPPLLWTANTCSLTIGGVTAQVTYCGAVPGEIIYQLNFVYPSGIASVDGKAAGTITVNGNTGNFTLVVGPTG